MSMQDRSRCCAGRTIAVGSGNTQPVSSSSVHARPRSYTCLAQQSSPPDCDQQSTPPQRSHVSGQQTLASTALFEGSSAKCTCPIFPIEHSSATAATASVRRVTIQDRAGMGWVACDHGPGLSAAASAPPRSARFRGKAADVTHDFRGKAADVTGTTSGGKLQTLMPTMTPLCFYTFL